MRILLVDDDLTLLEILQHNLARLGHEVELARDGDEALTMLADGRFSLVVTDWEMPGTNGLELVRKIRAVDPYGRMYVLMLTARDTPAHRMDGLFAGADGYIAKPFGMTDLLAAIQTGERILALNPPQLAINAA